jgi:hypothetical protein
MCTSAPQTPKPQTTSPRTSAIYPLPPRPIPMSCQPIISSRPLCLLHLARTLQSSRILPLAFSLSLSLCHIHPHGLSSSHIHTEHAKSPLPDHRPFTTSCQVLQSSRRPPRLPASPTMSSPNRSKWQNEKASMSRRYRVDRGLSRSQ